MKKEKPQFKIQKYLLIVLFLFIARPVFGAELFFEPKTLEIKTEDYFQVDLILDAKDEEINAIEGKIIFPPDLLEVKEVLEGGSIITLWLEKPRLENKEIIFSGIIPGGFMGILGPYHEGYKPGKILSLIFKTKADGKDSIDLKEIKILLNDGLGTPTQASFLPFQFKITPEAPHLAGLLPIKDADPPEPFEPAISQDPNIFEGKWFLVFATQDKGVGIDHYEIQENRKEKTENRKWLEGESPYLLKDQKLKSYIYVKALDKAGNERIAVVEPKYPLKPYENYYIWIIIILGIIIAYVIWRTIAKQKRNK